MRFSSVILVSIMFAAIGCGSGTDTSSTANSGGTGGLGGIGGMGGSSTTTGGSGGEAGGSSTGGAGGSGGSVCMGGGEIVGEGEPLAAIGACGKLEYRTYANRGSSAVVHRLPDFSYAGYMGGGVAIPDIPVVATVSPISGDDRASIQAAIDTVAAMPVGPDGFRGAVLLKKGTYQASDSIVINASGIVLRGEGQGASGTIVRATGTKQYDLIVVQGNGSGLGEVSGTRTNVASSLVPVGARSFDVDSAAAYKVGDRIAVVRTPNQQWIDDLGMGTYGWTPAGYEVEHERTITKIEGNTITIDIPIVDALQSKYGGGAIFLAKPTGRIEKIGIENLRLDSTYQTDTDELHGWVSVYFRRTQNAWVRGLTAIHFGYSAVAVGAQSRFITVEDSAHLDPISQITGGRRYPFYVEDGQGVLFQRCFTRNGRHSFVTGSQVTGPNVWLDCLAETTHADDGPHHRWATGLLFDNTSSGELRVQNRKDSGSGHGWAGAQTLFWNAKADSLVCDAPVGAMNWAIGCTGTFVEGQWAPEEPAGWSESKGNAVTPRSLYLKQLEDRLGTAALESVTAPAQRKGRIWSTLSTWAGEGALMPLLQ